MATLLDREVRRYEVPEHRHLAVEDDAGGWTLVAAKAESGARMRHAFRDYLEYYGHPGSDFDAAEAVYGELVSNCVRHAPGGIRIEFRWHDRTLVVIDEADRLRSWPFSAEDTRSEATHHAYALISAYSGRIHVTRDPAGGTRASMVLPVTKAAT